MKRSQLFLVILVSGCAQNAHDYAVQEEKIAKLEKRVDALSQALSAQYDATNVHRINSSIDAAKRELNSIQEFLDKFDFSSFIENYGQQDKKINLIWHCRNENNFFEFKECLKQ